MPGNAVVDGGELHGVVRRFLDRELAAVERDVVEEGFSPSRSIWLGEETSFVVVSWCAPKAWEYPLAHKLHVVDLLFAKAP